MTEIQQMKLAYGRKLVEELIEKHNLHGWKFGWSRSKTAFGMCSYSKKTIFLSKFLTPNEECDHIKNTCYHEVAHALTPGAGHGPDWKAKMHELGFVPSRTASLSNENKEAHKEAAPWALVLGNEVIRTYFKKPSRTIPKLPHMWLRGRKSETYGKLRIIPNPAYKKV